MSPTHHHHQQQQQHENDIEKKCLNNGACVTDKASIIETFEQHDSADKHESPDYIGNFLGAFGRWQLRTILLIYLCKIPSSWFMSCVIFTAPTPEHGEVFCKPPDPKKKWIKLAYTTRRDELDQLDQEVTIDFCNLYEDAKNQVMRFLNDSHSVNKIDDIDIFEPPEKDSILVPCKTFENRKIYNSIITQYDLYCSRDILVAVTQFFHLFGVLCGGIIATNMLKFIEPRRVMLIGMVTQIICGNITGHAHTFEMHMIFRCCSAICCGLMYTAGGLIYITSGKYRIIAVCCFEQFWSIGIMLLPAVASYWSSWNHLYMAISFPTVILIALYPWIPNSPRWLLQKGRVLDAKKVLLDAARVNGKNDFSPSNLEKQLQIQAMAFRHAPKEPSYCEMWRGQFKNLTAVHLAWSVYIVIYYGFLLNIRNFGRQYLEENTIVAGICEITGTFIGLWFILNTQQKWLYTGIFNVIASFISLSAHLIPHDIGELHRVTLLMITSMASKIAISSTLSILITCTTEIVSPEKRRLCGYTSTIWARIWLLTSPFVGATAIFGKLVPQTFLSFLNIIGASLTVLIDTPRSIEKKHKEDKYLEKIPYPELWLAIHKQ